MTSHHTSSIRSSGCNSMKRNHKGSNILTRVTLACPDHSLDCWVLRGRNRGGAGQNMSAMSSNDTVAISTAEWKPLNLAWKKENAACKTFVPGSGIPHT